MKEDTKNLRKVVNEILSSLPQRHQDVVMRRFGIDREKRETLEAIGNDYGITRERVRQIEDYAISVIKKPENFSRLQDFITYLENHIKDHGHVMKEEKLLSDLAKREIQPHLFLVLTLGEPFERIPESERFHSIWTTDKEVFGKIEELFDAITAYFDKIRSLLVEAELLNLLKSEAEKTGLDTKDHILFNYLDTVRHIQRDHEGRFGLKAWPEVTPRGVRDKSYIVMKEAGKPLHFRGITDLINQTDFSSVVPLRQAFPQTVHNELIKDERFVLIGRGTYALTEWGYRPGVVKDVVKRILAESKTPLTRNEILEKVFAERQVKKNTIILNLQDKSLFKRLGDGSYTLA